MTAKPLISGLLALMIMATASSGAVANTANERSYEFVESAIELFNKGDYRGAIIQLRNAIQQDARNPTARILLGRSYLQLEAGQLAERELDLARRIGAHPNLLIEPLGRAYLLQRKFKQLFEEIKPGHRGNHLEAKILGIRGDAYFASHDWKKAEKAYQKAARLQRHLAFPLLGQARIKLLTRQFDEAQKLNDKATKLEPNNPDTWYQQGEIGRIRQNPAVAISSYGKALDIKPNHVPARLGRATILLDLNRYDEALEDISIVRGYAPTQPRAAYLQSIILTRKGRINEAQALLTEAENILKKRPPNFIREDPPSLLLLGVIGFAKKNYEDSYGYLKRYLELKPGHPGARKMLGWMLLKKGEAWSAIKVLTPAVPMAPNDFELLTQLAKAHMQVKQYSKATELLEKASELAPDRARIRTQLGLSRFGSGQSQEALDDLGKALSLAPDGSQPGQLLGLYYLRNAEYDEALSTAKSIANRDPQNPFAYNLSGAAYLGKGNRKEARRQFQAALDIDPDYIPAYFNIAKIDIAEGNLDTATDRYYEVLQLRPKNVKAMRALAEVFIRQKDTDAAIKLLQEIGVLDPDATEHQVRLVDLYLRQKENDLALNLARDLEIVHPTKIPVLKALGRALLAVNKYQEAAERYQRAAEITLPEPEKLRRIARLQEKARDYAGARNTLRKAIGLKPGYLPVQVALIRLEERTSNFDSAMEIARMLRRDHPNFRVGDIVAGDLFMRTKQFKDAVEAYESAFAKRQNFDVVQRLYDAKYRAGQSAEAFAFIADWTAKHPKNISAISLMASAHRRAGNPKKAIEINEGLLAQRPNDPGLLNNLAGLYQIVGDKRAQPLAEKAYSLSPRHPVILDTYGWILVTGGDVERGLTLLRQAFTRNANNPEVRYHLAVALSRLGRKKEAREELQKALETGETFEGVKEARKLLRTMKDG